VIPSRERGAGVHLVSVVSLRGTAIDAL
jgi:hypothetical protein